MSLVKRIRILAAPRQDHALQKLLHQYEVGNASIPTLRIMQREILNPSKPSIHSMVEKHSFNWCSVGGHPVLYKCLPNIVHRIPPPVGVHRVRVCWKNRMASLLGIVKKCNSIKTRPARSEALGLKALIEHSLLPNRVVGRE